jgi:hypothetical protein
MNRAIVFFLLFATKAYAQQPDSSKVQISWDGYIETYHTLMRPGAVGTNTVSDLVYNHSRLGEVNINIALLRAKLENENIRGAAAVMTGTYARYNLSHEPAVFQYIYELHAGIKLSKARNVWLDAGIFESYIGYENPIGINQPTLSRSLAAENTPYYLTGARLQFESTNKKWLAALYYLNGWQQMFNNLDGFKPSLGANIQYRINDKWLFNYSNISGAVANSSSEFFRVFHDFHAIWKPNRRLELRGLFDIGTDYHTANLRQNWLVMNAIARYEFAKNWYAAARVEYYTHPEKMMVHSGLPYGQYRDITGASINIDKQLYKNVFLRNEARMLYTNYRGDMVHADEPFANWMHYVSLCIRL